MKFGGTSVESQEAIARITSIVKAQVPRHPIVVVSAMGKTTNKLLAAATDDAATGILNVLANESGQLGEGHAHLERRLVLLHGDTVVRTYKIALGVNPVGQKERAGDLRTPEGRYFLSRRNPRSDYFLSIQVSYPNETDLKRAHRNHWDAGGSIMIHGLPNQLKHAPAYYEITDWTDGCIALSNADMVEVWLLTPDNAPIDILP